MNMKKIFSIILSLCLFGTAYGTAFTTDCGNTVSITATPATGYHFTQWQDGNTDNPRQVEVKASASYTASFAPNEYTIIFVNEDGTELQKTLFAYGTMPAYTGPTPTKPASAQHNYTFAGWSPALATVIGNATYTATYTTSVNNYTLTLLGENGVVTGAGTYEYGSMVTISATPLECYQFKQWSDGDTNATREITITDDIKLEAIFEVITYTIIIESANQDYGTVTIEVVDSPNESPEYVDLGLSVKWATCNIGATKPEEYGDYFAWGEVSPKDSFSEENHKWIRTWWHETEDGSCPIPGYHSHTEFTKYHINVDGKTILDKEDDAAVVNWGENWRMPTWDETKELLDKCIWEMTSQNGVSGFKVTGTNGNSIFLPADFSFGSQSGYSYWTSTVDYKYNAYQHAIMLYLDDDGDAYWEIGGRYDGKMVRPVKGSNNTSSTPTEPSNPSAGIGTFSVSADKQVAFSKGNLQYTQSTNSWSFANTQYETLGTDNVIGGSVSPDSGSGDSKEGSALADKIDLFGWSTASTYFGVSTSENDDDYSGSFVDWGTNQIGNDAPNTWRTLTYDEWNYLRNSRSNASSLCGVAQVNGVNGLIFLPDNWTCPAGVTFKSGFGSNYGVDYYADHQSFTADQWSKLETAGAVFLPVTGARNASYVSGMGAGYYSSATTDSSYGMCCFNFIAMQANAMCDYNRLYGMSVRLVKDL